MTADSIGITRGVTTDVVETRNSASRRREQRVTTVPVTHGLHAFFPVRTSEGVTKALRKSPLDRGLGRARGCMTIEAGALIWAICFVSAIAVAACFGMALSQRDNALAGKASATRRADTCAVNLARLTRESKRLDDKVRLHRAIDDDRCPCICGDNR